MWGIELKGFRRQAYLSSSQGQEGGKEDNVKYDKDNMNDKGNYYDSIFFKTISCHTISEPQDQAEVNDDGKYDKGHKNINDDNKMFFLNIRCHTFLKLQAQLEVNDDSDNDVSVNRIGDRAERDVGQKIVTKLSVEHLEETRENRRKVNKLCNKLVAVISHVGSYASNYQHYILYSEVDGHFFINDGHKNFIPGFDPLAQRYAANETADILLFVSS